MALFNYDRPGRGIDKNAPKKKGAALFFELVWRKLKLLALSSMLYFVVSLPIMALYFFVFYRLFGGFFAGVEIARYISMIIILTLFTAVLWGMGPVSCGYTYLMRSFAREEHVWIASDFFDSIKKNWKYGAAICVTDILMIIFGTVSMKIYSDLLAGGKVYAIFLVSAVFAAFLIYTFMHYYMYEFAVTFDMSVLDMFKNSAIMAIAAMPMNILLTLISGAGIYILMSLFALPAFVLIMIVFWISFMRFPIDFYTARRIKREFIDKDRKESK